MNEKNRNNKLNELLTEMVKKGEHGLNVTDILVSYMNNVMIEDEREEIIDRLNIRPTMKLSESITMVSSGGFIEEYPSDDEEFLRELCRKLVYDYRNDDKKLEEVIERYHNHPKKENLEYCIEDITEGKIEWNMTVDHNYGFTDGYGDWIFPA